MPKAFDYYEKLAERLIKADGKRDKAFEAYRDMYRNYWELPAGVPEYIIRTTDHSPHDAIQAGVRVLSSIFPKITVYPSDPSEDQKERANKIERLLKWHLMSADRRRPTGVVSDIVLSALLYAAVGAMVIDLDWQIDQAAGLNAETARMKALRRHSRFVVNTYYPGDLHVLRSSYGTEGVLLAQLRLASEVVAEWGDMAKKLNDLAKEGKVIEYYDWMDFEERVVWCKPEQGGPIKIVTPSKHELPFMPWVALMGGSTIESQEEDRYHPMLYPLYKTGAWSMMNTLKSFIYTDSILPMFKEEIAVEGLPEGQTVERDYLDPAKIMYVPPGGSARPLPRQPNDPAKMEAIEMLASDIERATVSRTLQGESVASGVSFAALNLHSQIAIGALKPGKELAEKALAELSALVLLWTSHTGKPLEGFGMNKKTDLGMEYVLPADEIEPDEIYISVELKPDNPTDAVQRANAGIMLNQIGYPKEYVLEMAGAEDPQKALEIYWLERLKEARVQNQIDHERLMMEMEHQQMMQEMTMAQDQQQMEAQQIAQQQQMEGPFVGGQGWNAAQGGMPPAMAFPEGTREEVQGEDSLGNALLGMEGL